jgi:hypothetical protein
MSISTAKSKLSLSISRQNVIPRGGFVKQCLTAAAALGLIAWSANMASGANTLFNGTLDQIGVQDQANPTPLGWTTVATKVTDGSFTDGGSSEPWCNVVDPGGYGFFFKPFAGAVGPPSNLLDVYMYQEAPATSNSI